MTSPSRKKHPTTRRSTARRSLADARVGLDVVVGADDYERPSIVIPRSAYENSTWLPAALLATLVLLATALQAFGGEPAKLEWRPAGSARASTSTAPQQRAVARPASEHVARPISKNGQPSRTYHVVQVGYDDYSVAPQADGSARLQSVLVHPRDPQFQGTGPSFRTAQDPFENDPIDDELSRGINLPFGDDQPDSTLPDVGGEELPQPTDPTLPDMNEQPTLPSDEELFNDDTPDNDGPVAQPGRDQPGVTPGGGTGIVPRDTTRPPAGSGTRDSAYERQRTQATEFCDEARERLRTELITNIDISIRVAGTEGKQFPFECILDDGQPYPGRCWPEVTYMWKAAANCHKPLYFEEYHLERYGHSWGPCLQPIVSGAHFFSRLPVLPYCMGITPPNECIYPLGYYRPGNCAPYSIDPIPFTWRAALFEAGAVTGAAAILP